jgi:hypothetical protein
MVPRCPPVTPAIGAPGLLTARCPVALDPGHRRPGHSHVGPRPAVEELGVDWPAIKRLTAAHEGVTCRMPCAPRHKDSSSGQAFLAEGKSPKQAIHDGDTVSISPNSFLNTRLLGVDTPEVSFSLPGERTFPSIGSDRWRAFLDDPLSPTLPPFSPPLPAALQAHLDASVGPGCAQITSRTRKRPKPRCKTSSLPTSPPPATHPNSSGSFSPSRTTSWTGTDDSSPSCTTTTAPGVRVPVREPAAPLILHPHLPAPSDTLRGVVPRSAGAACRGRQGCEPGRGRCVRVAGCRTAAAPDPAGTVSAGCR